MNKEQVVKRTLAQLASTIEELPQTIDGRAMALDAAGRLVVEVIMTFNPRLRGPLLEATLNDITQRLASYQMQEG